MQEVLKSTTAQNLHLYIVFLPILRSDDREAAIERTKEFADPRVTYYWDETLVTGKAWGDLLRLQMKAWDVYFLYPPQAQQWTDHPEMPAFWMHQLRGVDQAPYLDKEDFKLKTLQLLKQEKK